MNREKYIEIAREQYDMMLKARRHLHQNAELSFCEHNTSAYICDLLDSYGISYQRVAGTGVLAEILGTGVGDDAQCVVLRADIDALPMVESTDCEFRSVTDAMHACGHDLHTSWLLGALVALNGMKDSFSGRVLGLFQPGEEKAPGGASIVLKEVDFSKYGKPLFVGQHVDPEIEVGGYGIREGVYMASTNELHINVIGKGGHGALTNSFVDPVLAASSLLLSLQQIVSRLAPSTVPTVLSFGRFIADGTTNVIPDRVTMSGTLRTFNEKWRAEALDKIASIAKSTAESYGCRAEVNLPYGYPSVVNDVELAKRGEKVLREMVSEDRVKQLELRMTGEDFGFYTERFPSLFLRVGVKHKDQTPTGTLHSVNFNPNEEAMIYGAASMLAITIDILSIK